ncbi:EutP/PduV family microcompartment system protein [Serratia sp. DD3]|uniref:EutP/PduV family microcompartment system protein n=1 Tax=Serratia sp. DD3 TaxID=1410619 RepID=UPI0003C4F90F|nr:EutP/PduV family microcompartment system protein [Serratia sp. DD3]KEY58813.1 propanediol utilization protein PduV [Serratia sp. DD3]
MRRAIFVGTVGAGKTTLFNRLQGDDSLARKTQAVEFNQLGDIDTPGEYFSHPRLYHALISSLVDCELLIYVHAANDMQCRIPSGLLDIYPNQQRIAVITKVDLADAEVERVYALLLANGFKPPIFVVNSFDASSLTEFKAFLAGLGGPQEE